MFDDFLEYDVDLGAALMGATNLPQIGTALITVIDRYDGQCFDCAPILHRFTVGLLTFALAARIGERRIVLVGLRGGMLELALFFLVVRSKKWQG
ncbi:MAG: hypothetical protein WJ306_05100 [Ferrovum myxofaciens]